MPKYEYGVGTQGSALRWPGILIFTTAILVGMVCTTFSLVAFLVITAMSGSLTLIPEVLVPVLLNMAWLSWITRLCAVKRLRPRIYRPQFYLPVLLLLPVILYSNYLYFTLFSGF